MKILIFWGRQQPSTTNGTTHWRIVFDERFEKKLDYKLTMLGIFATSPSRPVLLLATPQIGPEVWSDFKKTNAQILHGLTKLGYFSMI